MKTTMAKVSKAIFIIKTENTVDANTLMRVAAMIISKYVDWKSKEVNEERSHIWEKSFLKSRKP